MKKQNLKKLVWNKAQEVCLSMAPSPGKDHLFASVPYQATAGRLQLAQTFTGFQVTTTVRMHLGLQQKPRMKQPRVRKTVVPAVWTISGIGLLQCQRSHSSQAAHPGHNYCNRGSPPNESVILLLGSSPLGQKKQ